MPKNDMNKFPKRKPIRLKDYDYSQNGAYFITICTKNMACILSRINVGHDAHIVPQNSDVVGHDAHIVPQNSDAVGHDAHIVPQNSDAVGHDAHIVPQNPDTVGHDAHIVPNPELTEYGKIVEKHISLIPGIQQYVIMPNHIHLIIVKGYESGTMWASCPTSISNDIKSFKTMVTKEIGKSIWQPRFYDHIIRDEYDYIKHLKYIEENPLKWVIDKYYKTDR